MGHSVCVATPFRFQQWQDDGEKFRQQLSPGWRRLLPVLVVFFPCLQRVGESLCLMVRELSETEAFGHGLDFLLGLGTCGGIVGCAGHLALHFDVELDFGLGA